MFTSQDLLNGVRMTQLNDPDATTWPDATLMIALNQALKALALLRPDATSEIAVILTRNGSRQFIPTDGVRLLSVVRNINADLTIGRAIRLVSQDGMDSMSPDWHRATGPIVKEYMFDSNSPSSFYIYPPVPAGSRIEIEYSRYLDDITEENVNNELPVSAIYAQPLQELMLYKLLNGDVSGGGSGGAHLDIAEELLNVKEQASDFSSSARRN